MKLCDDCLDDAIRRTKCHSCGFFLCSFCYETHGLSNSAGESCYFHMLSKIENREKERKRNEQSD